MLQVRITELELEIRNTRNSMRATLAPPSRDDSAGTISKTQL